MYSNICTLTLICLSEKDLVIITLNKLSVGKFIPKVIKLFSLDFRSFNLVVVFLTEFT